MSVVVDPATGSGQELIDAGPTVVASGLRVAFGDTAVLSGADLTVSPGSRAVLLGANGSGKTTLLRCLAGAQRPDAGVVEVCGRRLDGTPDDERRRLIHLVGHARDRGSSFADRGDVFAAVASGPQAVGLGADEAAARVADALDLLEIADLAHRPVEGLSAGQRQRVRLAGALAGPPAVLLLDEPTAGLDPRGRSQLVAALEMLQDCPITILVATSDTDFALAWAESLAVIVDGRIHGGEPGELLSDSRLIHACRLRKPAVLRVLSGLGEETDGVHDLLDLLNRLGDLLDARDGVGAGPFTTGRSEAGPGA